jgi:histidinol phosphatase-like PHP family hydrolase
MQNGKRIEFEILDYLIKQPSAKDTIQGITEWWILKQQIDCAVEMVSQALSRLVAKGYVSVQLHPNASRLYEINRERIEDIKVALNELAEEIHSSDQ